MSLLNRRDILLAGSAFATLPFTNMLTMAVSKGAEAVDVALQLGWIGGNGVLGETTALKKGFFQDEGLNLTIQPGGPNIDGIALVASGSASLGQYNSSPSIMLARSGGIPIKAFAAGYQKHPFTFYSKASNPVRSPKDLVGKKIATQQTSVVLLNAVIKQNNLKPEDIQIVISNDPTPLLTGQVDVATAWATAPGPLTQLGDQLVSFMFWDAGVHLYSNLYYATDQAIKDHQDMLVKFVKATSRGWGYAHHHPDEALDALVAAFPNLDRKVEAGNVEAVLQVSFNDTTAANGWGAMDPDVWQKQIDAWSSLDQFKGPVPTVEDVMTLEILKATADARLEAAK